jgi:hypothetical protein
LDLVLTAVLVGAGALASGAIIFLWIAGTPASRAAGIVIAAVGAIVQWRIVSACWHGTAADWDAYRVSGIMVLFGGLIAVACCPAAWAVLTLLRHARRRHLATWQAFAATVVLLLTLVASLPVVRFEAYVVVPRGRQCLMSACAPLRRVCGAFVVAARGRGARHAVGV